MPACDPNPCCGPNPACCLANPTFSFPPSVVSLEVESADLGLEFYVPHPTQGQHLHLGRSHLSMVVRQASARNRV